MLPPKLPVMSGAQQKLVRLHARLNKQDQAALVSFAEFLVDRAAGATAADRAPDDVCEPQDIARPADESVIAAIRRLTETYPMLDRDALLHETADLMSAHVLQGRAGEEVIDELEAVFRRHYDRVKSGD